MAFRIDVWMYAYWVPDGAGGAILGQNQSNSPGYTSALTPGPVGAAQSLALSVAEQVPGGDSPSGANFNTALTSAATDLGTLYPARCSRPKATTSSADSVAPGRGTTTAWTVSPHSSDGMPITATS